MSNLIESKENMFIQHLNALIAVHGTDNEKVERLYMEYCRRNLGNKDSDIRMIAAENIEALLDPSATVIT